MTKEAQGVFTQPDQISDSLWALTYLPHIIGTDVTMIDSPLRSNSRESGAIRAMYRHKNRDMTLTTA